MYARLLYYIRKYLKRYTTRFLSRWTVFGFDLVLLSLAYLFTQWIRFSFTGVMLDGPLLLARYGIIVAFFSTGFLVYQSHVGIIRHSGSTDFARLAKATLFAFVGLTVLREIALRAGNETLSLSYGALATTSLGFLALSVGMRITVRNIFHSLANSYVRKNGVGVLIFGAGSMGRSAKEAIDADVRGEGFAVAYVDDHPNKVGKNINGLPILSSDYAFRPAFIQENQIQRVVVAAKSVSALRIKALTQQALEVGLEVKRVPPIGKWVNGELTATQIRAVSVEDLLGRDPIRRKPLWSREQRVPLDRNWCSKYYCSNRLPCWLWTKRKPRCTNWIWSTTGTTASWCLWWPMLRTRSACGCFLNGTVRMSFFTPRPTNTCR